MNDSGSLQNLNDIVVPGPVAWWPPAPGWYVMVALAILALAWLGWNRWRSWNRNCYRREALQSLAKIRATDSAERAQDLPELLKRAALTAWPRSEVAALTGEHWHRFLDRSGGMDRFSAGAGRALDRLAYGGADALGRDELLDLYGAAEQWLRRHRSPVREA
ncbi:MAG: DUF4381 domain-containing protein [Lysobacterales bacterium]|jgi:hypothetical protein